ncbi:hypothetical protein C8J56DRAFT_800933 [Mycena floridula]|nr:hypothetical protein C8J56DRAFT_800933 [Mycena floridula]
MPSKKDKGWADGTRNEYKLDLNDILNFPDYDNVPQLPPGPGETWWFLVEVNFAHSRLQISFLTFQKRIIGESWLVVFDCEGAEEFTRNCEPGTMICIKNMLPGLLRGDASPDVKPGFMIKDLSIVKLLPCSLDKLREINEQLKYRSNEGLFECCTVCDTLGPTKLGQCANCKTRYCSKECQKVDWKTHKLLCLVFQALLEWNRLDWGDSLISGPGPANSRARQITEGAAVNEA